MTNENNFDVVFASHPEHEGLIAELNTAEHCVVEIRKIDHDDHLVTFCGEHGKNLGDLKLSEFLRMIDEAKLGLK